ncbi:MAG TPA: hypothetical protein VJ372_21535 [Pyrinomonadaceae bacterium]|jgi:hypothetical protein|nr:hypothetical protein [Pyrinomonadaceae bacterium]
MFDSIRNDRTSTAYRAVGFLLVLFIFYGITVEAAHVHGRFLVRDSKSDSVVQTGSADGSVGTKLGCNDCLICQLHQNLTATLIVFRESSNPLYARTLFSNTFALAIQSLTSTPQTGRAPPVLALI